MNFRRRALRSLCAFCCVVAAAAVFAQQEQGTYKPVMGQQGKDVVWIPSPNDMVELMLDLAHVTAQDYVVDLGSGDGRNVIAAAKRGARALGVEFNPDLVELSKRAAAAAGVADKASFVQGDMFKADISQATALILFLVPDNLTKLAPKFLELEPGTRIVSNTYEIGGGWEPEESQKTKYCGSWCSAHLYIVPAKVAGTWRLPDGVLALEQELQSVYGTREISGISLAVEDGRMRGNEIHFSVNAVEYSGQVKGETMEGSMKGRATGTWTARRILE